MINENRENVEKMNLKMRWKIKLQTVFRKITLLLSEFLMKISKTLLINYNFRHNSEHLSDIFKLFENH